jgi:hypothetical protein
MSNTQTTAQKEKTDLTAAIVKRMLQVVFTLLLQAAILFVASGRLDWMWAWTYLGVGVGILVINSLVLPPELIADYLDEPESSRSIEVRVASHRMQEARGRGTR